jgi:hypothetical protein
MFFQTKAGVVRAENQGLSVHHACSVSLSGGGSAPFVDEFLSGPVQFVLKMAYLFLQEGYLLEGQVGLRVIGVYPGRVGSGLVEYALSQVGEFLVKSLFQLPYFPYAAGPDYGPFNFAENDFPAGEDDSDRFFP